MLTLPPHQQTAITQETIDDAFVGFTRNRGYGSSPEPKHSIALMDDRRAHFLGLLEDVCAGAELAELRIEVQTITGARIDGAASLAGEIDQTSYNHQTVRVGTVAVAFQDVVSITVAAPPRLRPQ